MLQSHVSGEKTPSFSFLFSPQPLLIYARIDPLVYTGWIAKALQQDPRTVIGKRLPFAIDPDGLVAACSAAEGLFSKAGTLADLDGAALLQPGAIASSP